MAKSFKSVAFDRHKARKELDDFSKLLSKKEWLDERNDVLPLFAKCDQLCLLIGMLNANMDVPNMIAQEYDIFGDFICDLAVGDSTRNAFTLVEFEDAKQSSLFCKKKYCPEWGPRFEHGFSQLVDWFWKLDETRQLPSMDDRFGKGNKTFNGLLVVGRSKPVGDRERRRIAWRQTYISIHSRPCEYLTFDELYNRLSNKMQMLERVSSVSTSRGSSRVRARVR